MKRKLLELVTCECVCIVNTVFHNTYTFWFQRFKGGNFDGSDRA